MPPKPRLRQKKRSNTRHGPPRQKMSGVANINRRSRLSPNIIRLYEKWQVQQFVLRWSPDGGQSYQEIVRQQFNFSPPQAAREIEEYDVDLDEVTVLELRIVPDISHGSARASLTQLRVV